jgi:tetratricopeptide (TPR) repeat protein
LRPHGRRKGAGVRVGTLFVLAACLWLGGCALLLPQAEALRSKWPNGLTSHAEIEGVPFFPQLDNQCGPAALATVMTSAGVDVTPEELARKVYLPDRRGSLQIEMLAAPRAAGLVSWKVEPRLEDVLREVEAGLPVIVLQDYGVWPVSYWHYAVLVGFDRERGLAVLRSGEKRRLEVPLQVLEYTWKESGYWAMVVAPNDRIPVTAREDTWLAAIAAMERVADRRAARTAYEKFIQRWPDSLNGAIALANAEYALGQLPAAESALRAAVARHPKSVVALNNLAQVVSDLGRPAEALALVDEAITLGGPFVDSAQDTRTQILRKLQPTKP